MRGRCPGIVGVGKKDGLHAGWRSGAGGRAEDNDALAQAFKPVLPNMLGALAVKANSDPDVSLTLCSL